MQSLYGEVTVVGSASAVNLPMPTLCKTEDEDANALRA